jgi:hypothetical protein
LIIIKPITTHPLAHAERRLPAPSLSVGKTKRSRSSSKSNGYNITVRRDPRGAAGVRETIICHVSALRADWGRGAVTSIRQSSLTIHIMMCTLHNIIIVLLCKQCRPIRTRHTQKDSEVACRVGASSNNRLVEYYNRGGITLPH